MDDPEPKIFLLNSWLGISAKEFELSNLVLLGVVFLLLIFSALISGSEVAFFSLSPSERKDLSNSEKGPNKLIHDLLDKPRTLLATILVSNNLVNIAVVILSTYIVNEMFEFAANPVFRFVFEVVVITSLLLFFGEVIPKVYATKNGMRLIHIMVRPLKLMSRFFSPIINILISSSSLIENKVQWKEKTLSTEDLSKALELTSENEMQDEDQKILEGIVKFGNTDVKQIMVSRVDVKAIEKETKFPEVLNIVQESKYSRIPVFEGTFDNIAGILYIKDLLPNLDQKEDYNWFNHVRKPFFVPENKKIDDLFKEFQEKKIHLAVVVDEYGGASGIVTLDDILKEIMGDISEEVIEENGVQKLDDKNYLFDGKTPLIDFYKLIDVDENAFEDAKGESDTLAGFIIEISGRIPKKLEKITFKNCLFTVESANVKRVKEIKVTLLDD